MSDILKLLRPLLIPFSLLYGLIMWLRNKVYDSGAYAGIEFDLPVISVGNLSTGGTGKTPHVEYLVRLLEYEYKVATMSRGYKRKTRGFQVADANANAATIGDEPMQFFEKFPELVVSVCEDRMIGIPELMRQKPEVEVIVLDDAYQHRSVKPGLNILVTDFNKPFYRDFILPFGSLREARSCYKRADVIIVSKCPENLSPSQRGEVIQQINPQSHQQVFFSRVVYLGFVDFFSKAKKTLSKTANVVLVAGIAKPESLLMHLRSIAESVHLLSYKDHHYYTSYDLHEIKKTFEGWDAQEKVIVTTEKDAVRLALHKDELRAWGFEILVAPVGIDFLVEKEAFNKCVFNYLNESIDESLA